MPGRKRIASNRLAAAIEARGRSYRIWFVWGHLMVVTESREKAEPEHVAYVRHDLGVR